MLQLLAVAVILKRRKNLLLASHSIYTSGRICQYVSCCNEGLSQPVLVSPSPIHCTCVRAPNLQRVLLRNILIVREVVLRTRLYGICLRGTWWLRAPVIGLCSSRTLSGLAPSVHRTRLHRFFVIHAQPFALHTRLLRHIRACIRDCR